MMKKLKGFTLIEFVIVIVLLGIIAAVASKILYQGLNAYLNAKNITNTDWQGRLALARMERDIHSILSPASITTASASQLTFVDNTNTTVTYQLSSGNLVRNSQTLASGISTVTFSYYDATGATTATLTNIRYITVSLNITLNNENVTMATGINPRNLAP